MAMAQRLSVQAGPSSVAASQAGPGPISLRSSLVLPGRHRPCLAPGRQQQGRPEVAVQGVRRSPVITPDIVYGKGEDENSIDIYKYLLMNRIIFLQGYVNDKMATQLVGSLLALEAMDPTAEIRMYINSGGGQPYSVFGVLDTMKSIKCPIQTVGLGCCYSYASLFLAAGTKGRRFSMKNTRIMMTQPMGGSQGDMYQIQKTVEELNAIYQITARYYMSYTGMTQDQVERNTSRDYFMTPEEALLEGLIDGIIPSRQPDNVVPASVVRKLKRAGLVDRLSGGLARVE